MRTKRFIVGAALLGAGLVAGRVLAVPQMPIDIIDFAFAPAPAIEEINSPITWTNRGAATHTVTFDDGSIDSGPLAPGDTFTAMVANVGQHPYHCAIHPSMRGTIDATGQQLPPGPTRIWLPLVVAADAQ